MYTVDGCADCPTPTCQGGSPIHNMHFYFLHCLYLICPFTPYCVPLPLPFPIFLTSFIFVQCIISLCAKPLFMSWHFVRRNSVLHVIAAGLLMNLKYIGLLVA